MRQFALSVFLMTSIVALTCLPVNAMFSLDDTTSWTGPSPFSDAFMKAYDGAKFGSGADEAHRFEALLGKFTRPQEQAELHLTLGVIYNQRTGLVDHHKSIEHMTKGLEHKLSTIVLIRTYLWRGNSYESSNQKTEALKDYIRGLQLCLECDLPEKSPPTPVFDNLPNIGQGRSPEDDALIKEQNRIMGQHRFQTEVIRQRYYYVDAIKRVRTDAKVSDEQFKTLVTSIVKDKKVAEWILKRVSSPNPQPWK